MTNVPIVISGSIAIDRIMNFNGRYKDHIQANNLDSLSISIFLESQKDAYGGVGANIAYSLALLGDEPHLIGSVGSDGLVYMERLAHHGVNITHVNESSLPTASFNVITDKDQNQVGGFYPGAMFDSDMLTFDHWKDSDAIAVVSPHDPKAMRRQVAECKNHGLKLCYDVGQQVSNMPGEELAEGINTATILILNEYEMGVLTAKTGMSTDEIKAQVPIVVTTLGRRGSIIEGNQSKSPIVIGIAKPKEIVDPTGAGDAFRSGFLYGYARDWPLQASAQLGATCAAYAIETAGTQGHWFGTKDIEARYADAFQDTIRL